MLLDKENEYFQTMVNIITDCLNVEVPIISYDHDSFRGKSKEALGCAWSYDKKIINLITIDEFFIKECYYDLLWNHGILGKGALPKIEPCSLEKVICHEIAHITYWRHGKKHSALTKILEQKCNIKISETLEVFLM